MTRLKHKPQVGKYSNKRTRLGNILVGRRHGKSKLEIIRDMTDLENLHASEKSTRKWVATKKREAESIIKTD